MVNTVSMRAGTGLAFGFGLLSLAALFPAPSRAVVGTWESFTNVNPTNALIEYQGSVFAGTQGGVRKIEPGTLAETVFTNSHGLVDVRIVSLAVDGTNRLWAASRSGILFRLEGNRWSRWGNGYKSAGWTMNPRAMIGVGKYLVLGSEKGLTFFDPEAGVAQANLTKFGTLGPQSVTGIARIGDTLFIATGTAVMQAPVDWQNIQSTKFGATIYDPGIWTVSKSVLKASALEPARPPDPPPADPEEDEDGTDGEEGGEDSDGVQSFAALDSAPDPNLDRPVEFSFSEGRLVVHDSGTILYGSHKVKALPGRIAQLNGENLIGWYDVQCALVVGKTVYLGGRKFLLRYVDYLALVPAPSDFPIETIGAVAASSGKAAILTEKGSFQFKHGAWKDAYRIPFPSPEVLMNEMRTTTFLGDGSILTGTWGDGFSRSGEKPQTWNANNSCLHPVIEAIKYTVIMAMSDPRGDDVWMAVAENAESREVHKLAHFNQRTGDVSCSETLGTGYRVGAVRILSDDIFGVAAGSGVFFYKFGLAGVKHRIAPAGKLTTMTGSESGKDMAMDRFGRLWALFNGSLGYVDSLEAKIEGNNTLTVQPLENVTAASCGVMETDARGEIWIGCQNGLFRLSPAPQAELSAMERFTIDDGLLGDRILDVAADQETGLIWAATENGLSKYESESHPSISGTSAVKVYPNPFLKKHALLVLDNMPDGASATIFTQSGSVVRHFGSRDAKGHQFQWDGTNSAGARVKPGIYLYSVSSRNGTSRGKIIVGR